METTITFPLAKYLWNGYKRSFGVAIAAGEYVTSVAANGSAVCGRALAGQLEKFGLDDIDASALQKTARRLFTQLVSRIVFYAGFSGIYYLSKYGHDIENWALFEPFQITVRDPEPVRIDDSDLQLALRLHSLKLME